jgi:hypothetical protein
MRAHAGGFLEEPAEHVGEIRRADMIESHGDGLLDLVYGILPVAERPGSEGDARNGVA